jgi:SAM-dependent methyltransferase
MAALGADATGVEFDGRKVAARHSDDAQLGAVIQGDVENLPFAREEFDLVLFNEVLEHVPSDSSALQEARRVLKPSGTLVVFAPNRLYPFETHGTYLKGSNVRVPPYVPLIPYVPLPVGESFLRYWARNYWPWQLVDLVSDAGFDIVEQTYVWQTFENISGMQPRLVTRLRPFLTANRDLRESREITPTEMLRDVSSCRSATACLGLS